MPRRDITKIETSKAPAAIGPYSQAIQCGDFLFCAGQLGLDPGSGKLLDGVDKQTDRALTNLKEVLHAAGADMGHIVKTTVFLKEMNDFDSVNRIYSKFFSGQPPARSAIQVAALPKNALVEIEAIAFVGNRLMAT